MVHHYLRGHYHNTFRDNSYTRVTKYLYDRGDTMIFNFGGCSNYGYSNFSCGGGTFWGGFGHGIGMGLANLFSGFFGGFGMGMPMFNSMWGMPSMIGLGGPSAPTNKTTDKTNNTDNDDNITGLNDLDQAKLNTLDKAVTALETSTSPDENKARRLYNEIKPLSENPIDAVYGDTNKLHYLRLLGALKTLAKNNNWSWDGDEITEETPENVEDLNNNCNGKIKINNKTVDIDKLTYDNINSEGLTTDMIEDLCDEDFNKLLEAMGVEKVSAYNNDCLSLPKEMSVDSLKALKKVADARGLSVAVANNPNKNVNDNWIAGKIDDIKEVEGKLQYKVDCSNVGVPDYQYKYIVKNKDNNTWTIEVEPGTQLREGYEAESQEYMFNNNVLYRDNSVGLVHKKN